MNKTRRKVITNALSVLRALTGDTDVADAYKCVQDVITDLTNAKDEEQDAFDNLPEGLQTADKGQTMETNIEELDSAITELEGLTVTAENADWFTELEEAIENVDSHIGGL